MVKTSDFESENGGSTPPEATNPPPPLCVWCNAPWTDDMMKVYAEADYTCGEYGGVDGIEVVIDVTCGACNRLVYRKHVQQEGNCYNWPGKYVR